MTCHLTVDGQPQAHPWRDTCTVVGVVPAAKVLKHIGLPALGPAAVIGLYFTPVMVFGCVNRGLMAVGVVLISTVAAVVTTWRAARLPVSDRTRSLWLLSTLILLLPVALLFGPLG